MNTELETKLRTLNDELELLTSMVRAERITATPENRQCTDEQAERTHKALDACLAPHSPVGGEPVGWTKEGMNDFITHADRSGSIKDGGALKVMAEKFTIPLFTHPKGEVELTDEEAAHCAMLNYGVPKGGWSDPLDPLDPPVVFALGMRYARDNGYLTKK